MLLPYKESMYFLKDAAMVKSKRDLDEESACKISVDSSDFFKII